MVINISPDPTTDKLKKRRSSRTVGLTTTRETAPSMLWFRLPPGDQECSLQDWARIIQPFIQFNMPDRPPLSPITPVSPTFVNPFGPRSREPVDLWQGHSSGSANIRAVLQHKSSNQTHLSRDRPKALSESTSLRSKRSDISSHASSMNPSHIGYQNHMGLHTTDLPSPATTIGEYQGEFIEGWTSAQGRSSTVSSPVRGRDSISSQPAISAQALVEINSPSIPRETILDRAFQLRCIPGSEREVPGEEKLSSLARFDALMREADGRRKKREAEEAKLKAANEEVKSTWEVDESDSDDREVENGDSRNDEEEEDSGDEPAGEYDQDFDNHQMMPTTTQRALDYITGRRESKSQDKRSTLSYNRETLMTLNSGSSQLRPQTGYSRNRPAIAQRTHSQPHLVGLNRPPSTLGMSSPLAGKIPEDGTLATATTSVHWSTTEKRQSSSSVKRLSFTEFTKRLSSTSSLLLVQTNASSNSAASSRNSEVDLQQHAARNGLGTRGAPPSPAAAHGERDSVDKRCGWRGSVGVFGAEGGFL